jgi:acyl-CoA thioesterase-2
MPDLWTDLLDCLDLRARPSTGRAFEAQNQRLGYHRLFGGQLLAQMIRSASLVVPTKTVKSLHVLFPRAGRTDEPVQYTVDCQHEGGSFATLAVVAHQEAGVVASALVSMHAHEDGREHQTPMAVPALPGEEQRADLGLIPWETRTTTDLDADTAGPPEYDLWMRTPPVDPDLAPALTAYATDLTLIGTALRPLHGVSQRQAGTAFTSAVTSHTIWFHRPFRTDTWLLLRQHAPVLAHGRCFGRGDVLDGSGTLVASYAQEAMVRFS